MILTHGFCLLLVLITVVVEGKASYVHGYLPTRYYTSPRAYSDDNVYITDKYGQVVSVEPSWSRSSKSYDSTQYYTKRCYNCIPSTVYEPYPYSRKVYVKDRFGNSVLVNPSYVNDVYEPYYPSSRNSRYYSSGRKYSTHEDYVYVNDMYGRTRAVPKANYLYEYAKGY